MENNNLFNDFIKVEKVKSLNIWFIGYIPLKKKPGSSYLENEIHWSNSYDYLKTQLDSDIEKPNLIVFDGSSFYHYLLDMVKTKYEINTLII